MAWFATALGFLLAALMALVAGWAGPDAGQNGLALAAVHLFALGWLGQMMLGALIQFVPVLVAQPLAFPRLALPALGLCVTGVGTLVAGFAGLAGWEPGLAFLSLGPLLLGGGFALVALMLGATILRAKAWRQGAGRSVLLALFGLAGLWATGAGMAEALAGQGIGVALVPDGLPFHILLGLGLWLSLAAFGVSYKLFPMFLLASEADGRLRALTFTAALLAAALVLVGLLAVLRGQDFPLWLPVLPMLAAASLYLVDIAAIWRSRKRPRPEVNMLMSRAALAFLVLAALLILPAMRFGGRWAEATVFAAAAGWLSMLTLAQLVKITSFLTWIQVFATRIGRAPVPMVQDLTDAHAVRLWLWLWCLGAGGGTLALLAGAPLMFRCAALALLIAALGLVREVHAIRRLVHLPVARRPGTLPPLILPVL